MNVNTILKITLIEESIQLRIRMRMGIQKMATIYDIAKRCSVSIATVSRALNGHPDVSAKTRNRILEVCRELSYQPSAAARGLTLNRSWTIGVYFDDHLTHPLYQHILSSFKNAIELADYDLLFFNTHGTVTDPEQLVARSRYRNIDGMLIAGTQNHRIHERLIQMDIPCVGLNTRLDAPKARYVISDHYGGALSAVNFLMRHGHREIGFIGSMTHPPIHDRYLGYVDALQSIKVPVRTEWVVDAHWTEEEGYRSAKSLLQLSDQPTAIFCGSDMQAIGAMRAFEEAGLRIGDDISIIGFDDVMLARYVKPKLTTVRQDQTRLAEVAAQELIQLIEGTGRPESMVIPTQLVVRDSVCTVRQGMETM